MDANILSTKDFKNSLDSLIFLDKKCRKCYS